MSLTVQVEHNTLRISLCLTHWYLLWFLYKCSFLKLNRKRGKFRYSEIFATQKSLNEVSFNFYQPQAECFHRCLSVHNRPHGYSFTPRPCYGAVALLLVSTYEVCGRLLWCKTFRKWLKFGSKCHWPVVIWIPSRYLCLICGMDCFVGYMNLDWR